ncbi:MAG TPA: peptidoglycan DD-metalloendopeptidase family protein [Paraburkholderia sp.]|jgi:murein DD-endopeptidase MepM/ murein hydrolase activator NlpD
MFTEAAGPAPLKRKTQIVAAARAVLLIGTASILSLPAASGAASITAYPAATSAVPGAAVNLALPRALPAESFDAIERPAHGIVSASSAHAAREFDDLSWTLIGDAPAPSDTMLRHGAPILASMCRAAPVLCMPAEQIDAGREWAGPVTTGNTLATDSDATRFPLIGASPSDTHDERYITRAGRIERDLHDALTQADLPPDVLNQIERLFAGRLDVYASALPGDDYRIVYERADRWDAVSRHPRVVAVEIRVDERTYTALWFIAPGSTRGDYYAFDGQLLAAEPFAMPVNFERISSPFGVRLHPVSGEERFHTGVDLTAPVGAPVFAAAAGTVEFVGTQSGYGRHVVISHADGYTTCYAHLSAFSAGLRAGAQVAQGERVGFVGRSGVTTGPHLHFEVRLHDQPTDPLALTERVFTPPLTPDQRVSFERAADVAREQLAALPAVVTRVAANRTFVIF